MPKVFISYSREDLAIAKQLEQALIEAGYTVWRDERDIAGGQNFPKAIGEAIASHDILLLLWSHHAAQSHFVEMEWSTALALKKPILPCLLDDSPLPPALSAINGIFVNDLEEDFPKIRQVLHRREPENAASAPDNARKKKPRKTAASGGKREPRWWIIYILAPVIAGIILLMFQHFSKPQYGELHLESNIDSATVFLNRTLRGYTAADSIIKISGLQPGNYLLMVEKDPYRPFREENITIRAGEITSRRAALSLAAVPDSMELPEDRKVKKPLTKAKEYPITITVHSKFKHARIFIDSEAVANAPNTISLAEGRYTLRVEKGEFFYEEIINVPQHKLVNITESEFQTK